LNLDKAIRQRAWEKEFEEHRKEQKSAKKKKKREMIDSKLANKLVSQLQGIADGQAKETKLGEYAPISQEAMVIVEQQLKLGESKPMARNLDKEMGTSQEDEHNKHAISDTITKGISMEPSIVPRTQEIKEIVIPSNPAVPNVAPKHSHEPEDSGSHYEGARGGKAGRG
jgi:hypothetical protein